MADDRNGGERDALAPVIPLFGGAPADEAETWHATWLADTATDDLDEQTRDAQQRAEQILLKRLRTRSLSLREADTVLREHEIDAGTAAAIVARFTAQGYLDDAALAEQLIDKGLARKAQGRQALAQTLSQRGIPREVIDAALAELPDDEAERALAFARQKAAAMRGLDRDAALRRLTGQLARRGFGAAALSVARRALDETARPSGVRFE